MFQVYHMCDGLGRQFSYTCPNATLFQQRMLICDHWYMVNCSKSEEDYSANLLIGQREKPFVDDKDENPYYRTPRPDLLSHPTASEANIIYRIGRTSPSNNIVGAEVENETSTNEPSYFLPSHWSTEYSKDAVTQNPNPQVPQYKPNEGIVRTNYDNSKKVPVKSKAKAIQVTNKNNLNNIDIKVKTNVFQTNYQPVENSKDFPVNFKSNFKATTPVYPKTVDIVSEAPDEAGLVPPIPYAQQEKSKEDVKASTKNVVVNYKSNFKATTPVYPTSVEATSPNPDNVGLVPPQEKSESQNVPSLDLDIVPPAYDDSYLKENRTFTPETPSKFYQPPRFLPDFTEPLTEKPKLEDNLVKTEDIFRQMSSDQWSQIRKSWLIPDYEFPLDAATRPSYDAKISSFDAKRGKK